MFHSVTEKIGFSRRKSAFSAGIAALASFIMALSTVFASDTVNDLDRVYRDFPFTNNVSDNTPSALSIALTSPFPQHAARAVTVHIKSGEGWYTADLAQMTEPFCNGATVRVPLGSFVPESKAAPITEAEIIRISAWKGPQSTFQGPIELAVAEFATPSSVAIIRSTDKTAPGESEFAASLADRCARILTKCGIEYDFASDDFSALIQGADKDATRTRDLIFLPYSPQLSTSDVITLGKFSRKGGKIIAFYNASAGLGRILGINPGPWQESGTYAWSAIELHEPFDNGRTFPHFTQSAIIPHVLSGSSAKSVATWVREYGRRTKESAITISNHGAYFAHIPPRAFPAAVDLFTGLATNLVPDLKIASNKVISSPVKNPTSDVIIPLTITQGSVSELDQHQGTTLTNELANSQTCKLANSQTCKLANSQTRKLANFTGITGAWLNSTRMPTKNDWTDLAKLKECGLNTLFVHWQSANYLLQSYKLSRPHGKDAIDEALESGRKNDFALHAWVTCFSLDGVPETERKKLLAENRGLKDNDMWLDPTLEKNQDLIIEGLVALAKRGLDGIHLDYVRTDENTPQTQEATEAITKFIRKASASVRMVNKDIRFSAAVFPTPLAASHRNQDWPTWVREGLVDFVSPMIYTESPSAFKAQLDACLTVATGDKLVPGIGTGADESQIDTATAAAEIATVINSQCSGYAFFALDSALMEILENMRK